MPSPFQPLVDIIHTGGLEAWRSLNEKALAALFGSRYHTRAEKSVLLRAPEMRGDGSNVPYAAYIHPNNPESGMYGGMSFVIFPIPDEACLIGMGIGTQGLSDDETILSRPGHARKLQAVCTWLNREFGAGEQVAWAKQDPTRVDIDIPEPLQRAWSAYERVFKRYGRVMYALYKPTSNRNGTLAAVTAMLDIMFEERGYGTLREFESDATKTQSAWFSHLMPETDGNQVVDLLKRRRFVILQGPPGTGKTRMARQILATAYNGNGRSVQFHPSTTYENFVGGLAPVHSDGEGKADLGFRFAPRPGFLLESAARAATQSEPVLLHIDEINRADLGKVLGEAIYLFEPNPEGRRNIDLPYDFGEPFHRTLYMPDNVHVLGTMNTADRSIAILDVAVRRRFAFVSVWPSLRVVQGNGSPLACRAFKDLLAIFVEYAPDEAFALMPGHSYFLGHDEARARDELKTSLLPLLSEYLAQGYVSGFAEPIRSYIQWIDGL